MPKALQRPDARKCSLLFYLNLNQLSGLLQLYNIRGGYSVRHIALPICEVLEVLLQGERFDIPIGFRRRHCLRLHDHHDSHRSPFCYSRIQSMV